MRGSKAHVQDAAGTWLNNPAVKQARSDVETAIYRMWLDSAEAVDREKLHGVATGAEMFWQILEQYERTPGIEAVNDALRKEVA